MIDIVGTIINLLYGGDNNESIRKLPSKALRYPAAIFLILLLSAALIAVIIFAFELLKAGDKYSRIAAFCLFAFSGINVIVSVKKFLVVMKSRKLR